jgi:hypothetical protein
MAYIRRAIRGHIRQIVADRLREEANKIPPYLDYETAEIQEAWPAMAREIARQIRPPKD